VRPRRRRRSPVAQSSYRGVGTVLKQSLGAPQNSLTSPVRPARGVRALTVTLITAVVLVVGLGVTAGIVLATANGSDIPKVTDIAAKTTADSIQFSWTDPGIATADTYQVTTSDGRSSMQLSPTYAVDAQVGDRVCITVTVNREGKTGPPSAEKCVAFGG
jgi:hypothetical protein